MSIITASKPIVCIIPELFVTDIFADIKKPITNKVISPGSEITVSFVRRDVIVQLNPSFKPIVASVNKIARPSVEIRKFQKTPMMT